MSPEESSGPAMASPGNASPEPPPYVMSLSLNVLNHLGINLYSNVPAVVSEAVANAWDAGAKKVEIKILPRGKGLVITDDGHGMTRDQVNHRFLHVGYERRKDSNADKPKGRKVMGRKGIGKLSLFAIADKVDVFTLRNGERSAFRMDVELIKRQIGEDAGTYHPESIDSEFPGDLKKGTRLVLSELKKKVAESWLRRRLARRFTVIEGGHKFAILINRKPVKPEDRAFFEKVQLLWYFGGQSQKYADLARKAEKTFKATDKAVDDEGNSYRVDGWIGTALASSELKDGDDNLNRVSVLVRGKLAIEDLLETINAGGIFSKYVIGELHADFLDDDEYEDIATSSRQDVKQDDPRYRALRGFLGKAVLEIQNRWKDYRNEQGVKKALESAAIARWYESLDSRTKTHAKSLFGKINVLPLPGEQRVELFKHGIIAFESFRYRHALDEFEEISAEELPALSKLFKELDDVEAVLYHQIAQGRMKIINKLGKLVDRGAKEKFIQEHLFDHLWLLDPSWERAAGSARIEQGVVKEFNRFRNRLTAEEAKGRIDIRYRTTAGKHLVIELKKASVRITTSKTIDQLQKYREGLRKVLDADEQQDAPIECIVVLGEIPVDWTNRETRRMGEESLKAQSMRVVLYDKLISDAQRAYAEYVKAHDTTTRLMQVLREMEGEFLGAD